MVQLKDFKYECSGLDDAKAAENIKLYGYNNETKQEEKEKEKAERKKTTTKKPTSSRKKTSALDKAVTSAANTIGRELGKSLIRGLLGSLKR